MKRVNRLDFLRRLESVMGGVTPAEGEIQSNCLAFRGGMVYSYNGEIAAAFASLLEEEVTGAVRAVKLVNYIQKLTADEIEITGSKGEFTVKSGRESAGFPMEAEILLPIDSVEQPGEWKELPQGFLDAVAIVQQCATEDKGGKSKKPFITTVVHIHPKWLEASDGLQVVRYRIPTPIVTPALVRQKAIKQITSLGVIEFSETPTWLHFRNAEGLVYSCRCFLEQYPSDAVSEVLRSDDGQPAVLPKGLMEVAERALIFSEQAKVHVELAESRLRVKGRGATGEWYDSGKIKVAYTGEPLSFLISPKLLGELAAKHNDIYVSDSLLKIKGTSYKYATVLGINEEAEEVTQPEFTNAEPEPAGVEE